MGPPPQPQGLRFCAPCPWGTGEQDQSLPEPWQIDKMEGLQGGEGRGAGLRYFLRFDPGNPGFDRALLGASLSALLSRLLGWSKNGQRRASMAAAEESGESAAAAAAVAVGAAAAFAACLAAVHAADQPPRRARRRGRLLAPDDGLRIVSSKGESLENVLHGASIGAGYDDEPLIVARVPTIAQAADIAGANAGGDDTELERVRELWLSLVEREQRLQLRLQELEGLREQHAAVRELEHRAAAAAAENRVLELRVAALQDENGRLRSQAAELDDARAELARVREKLRAIEARARAEQEEARREAEALRQRAGEVERRGEEAAGAVAAEAAALRRANAALEEENMELALRLQDAEQVASSVNLVLQDDMVEEAKQLRETNQSLTRQIEQLHSDHCAHVEELVYLKWVNACLRHELRDLDLPSPARPDEPDNGAGGMSAMDLSKSMSFRSSERAKQLMLRYGHPGLDGFDPSLFSPLHESVDGDGGDHVVGARTRARNYEPDRSPATTATTAAEAPGKRSGHRKLKFLGNIKKLLPGGKRSRGHRGGGEEGRRTAPAAPSDEYLEKAMQWLSSAHDVLGGDHSYESTPLSSCDRTPLSSATTATTADSRMRRGGGGFSERGEVLHAAAGPTTLTRSKSDAGASYGRKASRYHALRPDRPAVEGASAAPEGFRAPEKRELRRRSEELQSPARGGTKE
ncbi:hypothetical protein ACP4OV_011570 [Aristida adscensionis]